MLTRRQARLRSLSLPPPPTTPLAGVTQNNLADGSTSEPSQLGEMHGPAPGDNNPRIEECCTVSVRDEHPYRADTLNSVDRSLNIPEEGDEGGKFGLKIPGFELESHDSGSKIVVDNDVFVTPTRYARRASGEVSDNISLSNDTRFPGWFARQETREWGDKNNSIPERKFAWADSDPADDLPEIPFVVKTEDPATPDLGTPVVANQGEKSDLERLLNGTEGYQILENRMNKVRVDPTGESDISQRGIDVADGTHPGQDAISEAGSNSSRNSNRSIFGHYKRPKQPRRDLYWDEDKHTYLPIPSPRKDTPDQISFFRKQKWRALSSERSVSKADQDQINADYLHALELEREETRLARHENEQLQKQLAEHRDKLAQKEWPVNPASDMNVTQNMPVVAEQSHAANLNDQTLVPKGTESANGKANTNMGNNSSVPLTFGCGVIKASKGIGT
ncbi:hypothetical protein PILCRDRAFT_16290 [Piloderma croceum F 1598]|uniref:Uncharacterized protein n=1 Tax=Piloderma croceum (strain F 1598) TaxID=765440 RepID=A0A0C3EWZ4_PILCF|nr:hypothetical protein PILCRDRAFT_16290 [Piloderma croceum F 1598]